MTVLFTLILALHIINCSSCRNYWGGGGVGNDMFAPPPNIFIRGGGGGGSAPPPQDRRLCQQVEINKLIPHGVWVLFTFGLLQCKVCRRINSVRLLLMTKTN